MPLFISRFGTRAIMIAAFPLTGLGLLIFSLSNSIPAAGLPTRQPNAPAKP